MMATFEFLKFPGKKIGIVLAVTALGLTLVGYSLFSAGWFRKNPMEVERARIVALLEKDLKNLQRADATEPEVYAGMIRLAQMLKLEARAVALKRSTDPSQLMRRGSATALGLLTATRTIATNRWTWHPRPRSTRPRASSSTSSVTVCGR